MACGFNFSVSVQIVLSFFRGVSDTLTVILLEWIALRQIDVSQHTLSTGTRVTNSVSYQLLMFFSATVPDCPVLTPAKMLME